MLREALTYPIRGDDAEETLLVGVILALAAGLLARLGVLALLAVIPTMLLAGYALAVIRSSAESAGGTLAADETPPAFGDARALAVDGGRALVVAGGYLVVPVVALALTVGGATGGPGGGASGQPLSLGATTVLLAGATVVLAISATFAYLLPAALAGVARSGSIRSALDRSHLRRTVGDGGYFVGWVAALLVSGLAVVLFGALASFGSPGEILALTGGFYALVVVARLLGRGVAG